MWILTDSSYNKYCAYALMANILKRLFVNTQTSSDSESKSWTEGVKKHDTNIRQILLGRSSKGLGYGRVM
jgi:hypothetical protein